MAVHAKKPYSQGQPYRTSEDLSAQCDQWRRRTYWLTGLAAAVVALAVTAVVFAVNEARAAGALALRAEPARLDVDAPPAPEPPAPQKLLEPAPAKKAKLAAPKLDASQKERFLEAIGSLSAAHLFQSYLNIGLLADGVESEAYTVKQAEETLQSIDDMMAQVDGQLGDLNKVGLDADDRAALEKIKAVTVVLRLQGKFLKDYWKSDDKKDAERYHEVRQAAWKGLSKIMQLETK